MAQERIQSTIPVGNKWRNDDLIKKAERLGIGKTEFIFKAVDLMMMFDDIVIKKIQDSSKGFNVPEYLIIQNIIIKKMAQDAAKVETDTWGAKDKIMEEFQMVNDNGEMKTLTGEELFENLKEQYIEEIKRGVKHE